MVESYLIGELEEMGGRELFKYIAFGVSIVGEGYPWLVWGDRGGFAVDCFGGCSSWVWTGEVFDCLCELFKVMGQDL
jgi:hypothetical protein